MSIKTDAFEILNGHFNETGEVLKAKKLAKKLFTTDKYAYELIYKWRDSEGEIKQDQQSTEKKISKDFKKEKASVNVNSLTIKTLDEALTEAEVDLDVWEVDRYVINSWQTPMKVTKKKLEAFRKDKVEFFLEETKSSNGDGTKNIPIKLRDSKTSSKQDEIPVQVTNFQVKVWLKKKVPDSYEQVIEDLIKTLPTIDKISKYKTLTKKLDKDVAIEIALYDAHLGKFAWHPETMLGNWDIDICTKAYLEGAEKGLNYASSFKPSKIFFVLGNDFMHVDNQAMTTPRGGFHLDADGRFPKIARKAMETIVAAINICRQVAPVEIKWVPGNHDVTSSFWLSLIVEQIFKNDKHVIVDNEPSQRKAVLWGNLLVGWWHDATGRKFPASVNALAQFWPELWGKSKYRELHVGHKHKKVHTKTMPIETNGGVLIRQIPSLSSIDFWHQDNLFVDAVPASETLLWSKDSGVFGNFTVNVKPSID